MMSSLFLYSVILSTGGYPLVAVQVSVVVWVAGSELLSAVNTVDGVSREECIREHGSVSLCRDGQKTKWRLQCKY